MTYKATNRTMTAVAKSLIANATGQAHWQAHKATAQSQPAKELAFCSAWVTVFRLTQLKYNTLLTDRGKGERTTWGLPKYGRTEVIFGFL